MHHSHNHNTNRSAAARPPSLAGPGGVPPDPAPGHDPPDLDLAAPQVVELEALLLDLLALPALLPGPHLLLGAVPLRHHGHVVGLADLDAVLGVHGAMLALEARVSYREDVARADDVVQLRRGVGHVRVDERAVGARAHGAEGVRERSEKLLDEAVGGPVANDAVLLGSGGLADVATETLVE